MSPKLFADDYEDAGEEALSRLALRGGGGGGEGREGPSLLFCFTFSSRPLFPTPYRRLSGWCIRRAVVSRVGGVVFVLRVSSQHQQHVSLFSVTLVVVYGVEFESLSRNKIYVNQGDAL